MSLKLTTVKGTAGKVVFQEVIETVQGGHTLVITDLTVGETLPAGTIIGATAADETDRKCSVIKGAILNADAGNSAVDYQVKKGHSFKVGNYFAAIKGAKAYPITAIDTANVNYDVITISTTLGVALTAGQAFFQSSATGASAAAFIRPLGLLYNDTLVEVNANVALVNRGTVYARRVTTGLNADVMLALPTVIISNSY